MMLKEWLVLAILSMAIYCKLKISGCEALLWPRFTHRVLPLWPGWQLALAIVSSVRRRHMQPDEVWRSRGCYKRVRGKESYLYGLHFSGSVSGFTGFVCGLPCDLPERLTLSASEKWSSNQKRYCTKKMAWEQGTVSKPPFGHSFRWQALLVASSVACGNQGIEKEAELLGSSICYTPLPVPWRGNLCPAVNKRRFFPGAELDWHQLSSRIWNSGTWWWWRLNMRRILKNPTACFHFKPLGGQAHQNASINLAGDQPAERLHVMLGSLQWDEPSTNAAQNGMLMTWLSRKRILLAYFYPNFPLHRGGKVCWPSQVIFTSFGFGAYQGFYRWRSPGNKPNSCCGVPHCKGHNRVSWQTC